MTGKGCVLIESDALDIVQRLKEIDESYFLLLNRETGRYEIHSSAQQGDSFCLSLPFDALDARTLAYARRYRRERAEEIFKEIDRENEQARAREAARRREAMELAFENAQRRQQ